MFWVWGIYNLFENGLIKMIRSKASLGEVGDAALVGGGGIFCIVVAYLLGSSNWALVISRAVYHDDVRKYGSGNAGSTNVLRTYGKKAAILTFVGDGFKGVVSILIACLVFGHSMGDAYYIYLGTAAYFSAFFCILGHVFPCFAHFKGGKGFATTALSIIALNPAIGIILAIIFFPLVAGTRYVSLGSVVTVMMYPVILGSFDGALSHYGINTLVALLMGLLVTWAHRGNLKRIMDRTERKLNLGHKKPAEEGAEASEEVTDGESEHTGKKQPMSRKKAKRIKKAKK